MELPVFKFVYTLYEDLNVLSTVRALRTLASSSAQDQVLKLLENFKDLKEDFDRGVEVQTLETVNTNSECLSRMLESYMKYSGSFARPTGIVTGA
jgi:hypothetical protein